MRVWTETNDRSGLDERSEGKVACIGVGTYPSFLQPNFEKAEVPCFRFSSPIFCSTRDRSDLGAMLAMNLGM